ncbi:MAG TPA: TMEM165/GDT1 family protein [Methylomirabilota bacterium]|nr:TMEM165/GDT1 family protein [Methylomirabilota bacterium]
MTALWASLLVVALAEVGDRTQLVALALATQYRRPWTVMRGCCFPRRSRGRWG